MQDDLYIAFRQNYELMHSASVPTADQYKPQQSEYPKWTPYVVFAMYLCAAVLSSVHTIPTVYDAIQTGAIITETIRRIAAILSFVAVDLSVFMAAYMLGKDKAMAWGVLIVGFLVAMISNLSSVSKALNATDAGGVIVSVILGFGMPLLALMAGKMYVNINRAERYAIAKAAHDYQAAREAFDLSVLTAYNDYVSKTSRQRRKTNEVSISNPSNGNSNGNLLENSKIGALPSGMTRTADASEKVRQYFLENPDGMNIPVAQLVDLLGVKKSTIYAVKGEMENRK